VGSNADEIAKSFFGFTGKRCVFNRVEDGLVPVESKEGANVDGHTKEDSEGYGPVKDFARGAVEDQTDVLKAEQPAGSRTARTIHSEIGKTLSGLIAALHSVLVLAVRFAGPLTDIKGAKNVKDTIAADEDGVVAE
jgi:hypothetical protein